MIKEMVIEVDGPLLVKAFNRDSIVSQRSVSRSSFGESFIQT